MLFLVLFTLKSIVELYLIQMYIIKIYIVIYLPYFKKISKVVAIASNIEKRYTFLRVLNVRLEILKKNLHSKTF